MMSIIELEKVRKKKFEEWFEDFYIKEKIEKNIVISNQEGYTGISINLNDLDNEDKHRVWSDEFVLKMKEKLEGFNIEREEITHKGLMGTTFTTNKIIISWDVYES